MKLMTRFDTNKKRINSLTRCGKNIWVSTADSIQIRTEDTGDLLNEIPETAFALCAVNDTVWTVRESSIIIIDNSVCIFVFHLKSISVLILLFRLLMKIKLKSNLSQHFSLGSIILSGVFA